MLKKLSGKGLLVSIETSFASHVVVLLAPSFCSSTGLSTRGGPWPRASRVPLSVPRPLVSECAGAATMSEEDRVIGHPLLPWQPVLDADVRDHVGLPWQYLVDNLTSTWTAIPSRLYLAVQAEVRPGDRA